jgi:hypothetical protein
MMKWLNVAELFINLLGSGVIAAGVTASRAGIDRVTATAYGGPKVLAVGFWGCQLICGPRRRSRVSQHHLNARRSWEPIIKRDPTKRARRMMSLVGYRRRMKPMVSDVT